MNEQTREDIAAALPAANKVLKKITAYLPDFFKPSQALSLAWAEHISVYATNVPVEDLLAGVTAYFGANLDGTRPTPAAITQAARRIRQERFLAEPVEVMDAIAEARDDARAHLLYEQEPGLTALPPSPRTADSVVATPEYTDCPTCGARAGLPCKNNETGMVFTNGYHLARENAASLKAAEKRRALTPADPRTLFCGICDAEPGQPCTSGGQIMAGLHPERQAS